MPKTVCLYLVVCGILLAGCVYHGMPPPSAATMKVEMLSSRDVCMPDRPALHPVVYVDVRDGTSRTFGMRDFLEKTLEDRGYSITKNPSHARYILQMHIIHAGEIHPQAVRQAVSLGYGQAAVVEGTGATVLMADIWVAERTLPKGGPRQSHIIASVSTRSVVADEKWRIATLVVGQGMSFSQLRVRLEEQMALAVARVFPPGL